MYEALARRLKREATAFYATKVGVVAALLYIKAIELSSAWLAARPCVSICLYIINWLSNALLKRRNARLALLMARFLAAAAQHQAFWPVISSASARRNVWRVRLIL